MEVCPTHMAGQIFQWIHISSWQFLIFIALIIEQFSASSFHFQTFSLLSTWNKYNRDIMSYYKIILFLEKLSALQFSLFLFHCQGSFIDLCHDFMFTEIITSSTCPLYMLTSKWTKYGPHFMIEVLPFLDCLGISM